MAELPMNGSQQAVDPRKAAGAMANWAGAAVSLALILGAGVWGYKLLVRDVTGVPVVRAIEGPMREQPVDPGGSQAAHQGLAVNSVAAQGTAAAPADRFVLAPPPIELTGDDAPVSLAAVNASEVPSQAIEAPAEVAAAPEPITAPKPLESGDIQGLVDQLVASADPLVPLENKPAAQPKPAIVKGGIGKSLRPKVRPAGLKQRTLQLAAATPVAAAPTEVSPDAIPAGTRLVQLGAYPSADVARSEWTKLQAKFGDYLGDKQRVVQKATSGGRTFYRLRAQGFADLSDARRLCSALKAENADCIPVVTR